MKLSREILFPTIKIDKEPSLIMEQVSFQQGYEILHKFLEIYHDLGTDTDDLQQLIQQMQWKDGNPINSTYWHLWTSCLEKVLQDHDI